MGRVGLGFWKEVRTQAALQFRLGYNSANSVKRNIIKKVICLDFLKTYDYNYHLKKKIFTVTLRMLVLSR